MAFAIRCSRVRRKGRLSSSGLVRSTARSQPGSSESPKRRAAPEVVVGVMSHVRLHASALHDASGRSVCPTVCTR